jgi:hypothetical protein
MTNPMTIAQTYLAAWNTPDASERHRSLESWSDDARYRDPLMHAEGRDGIAAMIAAARAQFAGHNFALAGEADGHGDFVRFSWMLAPAEGGAVIARGTDVVRLDETGRIAEVIGFLDSPTP